MIWAYLIVVSIWTGYEFARFFAPAKWDQFVLLSAAIPIGCAFINWIFFALRYFITLNAKNGIFISVILTILCNYVHKRNHRIFHFREYPKEFYIVFIFLMGIFILFTDHSMLKNGRVSCGTIFSDLPFHLSLITSFSYGPNSVYRNMTTPFYLGEKLTYPIVPDFYSAILTACGKASLRVSLAVPTILMLTAMLFSMYYLFRQYSPLKYVAEMGMVLFVFAGGIGWKYFFIKESRDNVNSNYSHSFINGRETFWIQAIAQYIFPQRSGAFSIALCLLIMSILIYLVEGSFSKDKSHIIPLLTDHKSIFLAGVMMGILPMISAHAYISVGLYALAICGITFPWTNFIKWIPYIKSWSIFGFTAIVLSLPQLLYLSDRLSQSNNFISINPIWTETESRRYSYLGYFTMWWDSLGTFHFLSLLNVWFLMCSKHFLIYIPAIFVYVVANFVRFQPGAMDNTKVFISSWYPLACVASSLYLMQLLMFAKKFRKIVILAVVSLFISFSLSSALCFYKNLANEFPMFTESEMELGIWFMSNTHRLSNVFSNGWHACPPMSIGGRSITMGYPGWVWTHGLDYGKRYDWQQELYKRRDDYGAFESYKLRYAISKQESSGSNMFEENDDYTRWIKIIEIPFCNIFRLLSIKKNSVA